MIFFIEYLGFVPFKIEGSINLLNDYVEVNLDNSLTNVTEEKLTVFLKRILKKDVSVNLLSKKRSRFYCKKNWENLIRSHPPLKDYLRFLTPTTKDDDQIILRLHTLLLKQELLTLELNLMNYYTNT